MRHVVARRRQTAAEPDGEGAAPEQKCALARQLLGRGIVADGIAIDAPAIAVVRLSR